MPSYVISGASRGLGYAFVQKLSQDSNNIVFGLVRNRNTSLPGLLQLVETKTNVHILEADITDYASLERAAEDVKKLTGGTLDNLINNAAAAPQERAGYHLDTYPDEEKDLLEEDLVNTFKTNVVGVIKTINVFLPLLRAAGSAKVITLNTGLGDINMVEESEIVFHAPYSISKTALLMAIAKYAVKYKKENIAFYSISPGLVNTATKPPTPEDLEAFKAMVKNFQIGYPNWDGTPLTPEQSVSMMLNVVNGLTIKDTGVFVSQKGNKEWL